MSDWFALMWNLVLDCSIETIFGAIGLGLGLAMAGAGVSRLIARRCPDAMARQTGVMLVACLASMLVGGTFVRSMFYFGDFSSNDEITLIGDREDYEWFQEYEARRADAVEVPNTFDAEYEDGTFDDDLVAHPRRDLLPSDDLSPPSRPQRRRGA